MQSERRELSRGGRVPSARRLQCQAPHPLIRHHRRRSTEAQNRLVEAGEGGGLTGRRQAGHSKREQCLHEHERAAEPAGSTVPLVSLPPLQR